MQRLESAITKRFTTPPVWLARAADIGRAKSPGIRPPAASGAPEGAAPPKVEWPRAPRFLTVRNQATTRLSAGVGMCAHAFHPHWPPWHQMANRQAHLRPLAWTTSAAVFRSPVECEEIHFRRHCMSDEAKSQPMGDLCPPAPMTVARGPRSLARLAPTSHLRQHKPGCPSNVFRLRSAMSERAHYLDRQEILVINSAAG